MLPQNIIDTQAELFARVEKEALDIIVQYRSMTSVMSETGYGIRIRSQTSVHLTERKHEFVNNNYIIEAIAPSGRTLFKSRNRNLMVCYREFYALQVEYHSKYEDRNG